MSSIANFIDTTLVAGDDRRCPLQDLLQNLRYVISDAEVSLI